MATKQQSQRLDFLMQASHAMVSPCPTLARFYMHHYQDTLRQYGLKATKVMDRLSCPRCGQIYLAGDTTSVELVSSRPTQPAVKRNRKNTLIYTCHACHYRRKFKGSFKRHLNNTTHSVVSPTGQQSIPGKQPLNNNSNNIVNKNNNNVSNNKDKNKPNTMNKPTPPINTPHTSNQNKRSLPSTQPSKKKSKKNQLQSLLASRKDQQGGGNLGLNDFLSSL
ncbi:uncharacterized protein BX664DRAFT_324225 [Halteromyces radiatus]|uniref:uncharacterized protein n=1 Tax=Halteromyces radiatus TaxID=101107 RepID=UPI002220BB86|nr:uncharacterized protein BX664DRAFT_324225 [Halteromyces radiatus]KAI8096542.1 hypothetical protein BX664DRAFT_324225 [Halteromyces radiatus]